MKNRLLILIIFAFIFSSCSDFSGNEDAVEASLKPGPVAKQKKEEEEATRDWYHLNGITFGNNTFVAVGDSGTVRYSSDNGSSWDNGTRGTTSKLNEIAYGDSTFVTVGRSGANLYSSDNGVSWDNGTWGLSDHFTGVAFGNNTFIGVSEEYLTRSTDNGSNWTLIGSGLKVIDLAFGNSRFLGCGKKAALIFTNNEGDSWSTSILSGAKTATLNGVTFGNNQLFSVGTDGKFIRSTDNGDNFVDRDPGQAVSRDLNSMVIGNDTFVAVGSNTVIVSTDNGSTFTIMENRYTFNDVAYGNGVFVAVGYDEIIYTSTDGNTWTQVHGK